jgi:hypothetical protein
LTKLDRGLRSGIAGVEALDFRGRTLRTLRRSSRVRAPISI